MTSAIQEVHIISVIDMFARGYTVRHIKGELTKTLARVPTDQELLRLAVRYADDIDAAREQLAALTLEAGLAKKETRVRRLAELADAYEEKALTGNVKAANVYMKAIGQIHDEIDPLGLDRYHPQDPWAILLNKIRQPQPQP